MDMSQPTDATCPTCDERYSSREEVFDELGCAGILKHILKKEVEVLREQWSSEARVHGSGDRVCCPFSPWFELKSTKGRFLPFASSRRQ